MKKEKTLTLKKINKIIKQLGNGFSYIDSNIKLNDNYEKIDLLLFNFIQNCFVVVLLNKTPKKQIHKYMDYINETRKNKYQNDTIVITIEQNKDKYIITHYGSNYIYFTLD